MRPTAPEDYKAEGNTDLHHVEGPRERGWSVHVIWLWQTNADEQFGATRAKQKAPGNGAKPSQVLPHPSKDLADSNRTLSKHNALERDDDAPIGKTLAETTTSPSTSPNTTHPSLEEYAPFIIDVSESSDEEDASSDCDDKETENIVTGSTATVTPESLIATESKTWIVNSADLTKRIIIINGEQWLETKKLFGNCFWMIERLEFKQPARIPSWMQMEVDTGKQPIDDEK
ncbi:hypothetical protein B0J14DRAFT_654755 [Halenospora varia]|nr:hypothetical protein B0J14DRAFT_654755 [Halenospora varia]